MRSGGSLQRAAAGDYERRLEGFRHHGATCEGVGGGDEERVKCFVFFVVAWVGRTGARGRGGRGDQVL